jgi:hypothetical protein
MHRAHRIHTGPVRQENSGTETPPNKYDVFGWTNIELEFVQEDVLARVRTRLGLATQRGFTLSKSSYLGAKTITSASCPCERHKYLWAREAIDSEVRENNRLVHVAKVWVCVSRGRWKTRRSSGHLGHLV